MTKSFSSIITTPVVVPAINGKAYLFTPNPEGGVLQNGTPDPNMDGPGGYTYGTLRLSYDTRVEGYVCHFAGTFNAYGKNASLLNGREFEPSRVGLTSKGFDPVATLPNGQKARFTLRPNGVATGAAYVRKAGKIISGRVKLAKDGYRFIPNPQGLNASLVGA